MVGAPQVAICRRRSQLSSTGIRILACLAVLALSGCGHATTRPLSDGYTLHGTVRDAQSGSVLPDVQVLVGAEGSSDTRTYALTDAAGQFVFRPFPATAPSTELFRCERAGYQAVEVLARTATRVREFEYQLEIRLEPE